MRRWKFVVLALLAVVGGSVDGSQADACQDLPACIQQLRAMAQDSDSRDGMGQGAGALKQRILAQPGAVDALIPLLADPDKEVAELAAYALRDAPKIDPGYLPQLRKGLDRGLGWLAPALARMGTDEAAKEAVDRYLVSESAPENQEAYAVTLSGRRAIPFLVERASCRIPCTDETHYLLGSVLKDMGPERAQAGPGLMRVASDRNASPQAARGALLMIAELGTDGRALEVDLLREREMAPYLAPWIDRALVGIHSPKAGAIFAERLAGKHDVVTLRDLAEIGAAGRDAGPAVVKILEHEPDLRAAAARTLGYIGYAEATPELVAALDDPMDARVAWAAAMSLGRLNAPDALGALDRTASQHWYPPVRDAARQAAMQIRSGAAGPDRRPGDNFAMEFLAFGSINRDLPACRKHREKVVREPEGTKLHTGASDRKLKRLKYPSEVVSYGASDEEEQKAAGADIIRVHPGNLMEHRQPIEQVPDVALRVDGGWLAGSSRGEWGGELMFVGDDGRFQRILGDNVEDIYRLGTRIVATTGLAHLGLNHGALVEITRDSEGRWHATTWRVLPGAPAASFLVAPHGLMVRTVGGGAVVIDADGGMRMADCDS